MLARFTIICLLVAQVTAQVAAQDARLFADIPSIYLHVGDLQKIKNDVGMGIAGAFNVGTHNLMGRVSGGTTATVLVKDDSNIDFNKVNWGPFVRVELGAGLFRTNGDQCAMHNQNAYSLLPKVGAQYHFTDKQLQILLGVELAYFRIRDISRNSEFFLDPIYNITTKKLSIDLGYRTFFNLRAD